MIQFNLLPDVKQEFVKARRTKRMVVLVSVGISAFSLFVLLLFILNVEVVQRATMSRLNKEIGTNSAKLKAIPQIDKILTVQNQLNTLDGLHNDKVASSRLFGYLAQLTPSSVTISSLNIDFTQSTINISGNASALGDVNAFIDILKNTDYKQEGASATPPAFSKVVLSSFTAGDKGVSYAATFVFDAKIFDGTKETSLKVPSDTVTNTSVLFKVKESDNN